MITSFIRRVRVRRHMESEDVLKGLYHSSAASGEWCGVEHVATAARMEPARVGSIAKQMVREGLIEAEAGKLALTSAGWDRAVEMVRAHRLWESYLSEEANVAPEDVHEEAERLEHAHELADEVDQTLGHPQLDPHGEVIPQKTEPL